MVFTAVLYLPFLGQAFHIDDRIYLEVADQIRETPFFPYDYQVLFEGIWSPDAASHSHLPLLSYWIALVQVLSGSRSEWVMHLAFLPFALLAVWAFYDIARRYLRFPAAAGALLAASPAFLVLSHTLMADVPLLAFWLGTMAFYLRLADQGAPRSALWGCLLCLLASAFLSLLSGGLLLLMAAWWLIAGWKKLPRVPGRLLLLLLAAPLVLWTAWYLRAWLHYDRMVLINTMLHMEKRQIFQWHVFGVKSLSFILNLGAVFLFPLALCNAWARQWSGRLTLLLFFLSPVPFALWIEDWTWQQVLLFAAFFSSGLLALGTLLSVPLRMPVCHPGFSRLSAEDFKPSQARASSHPALAADPPDDAWQEGLSLLSFLWFAGILAAAMLLYYAGSARYVLLAAPPVILLWIKYLECRVLYNDYLLRNLVWLGFALTLPYGLWIAWGDYQFAEMYRRGADQMVERYTRTGRTLWFTAEWGLRYYLSQRGARPLPRVDAGPRAGDVLFKPYVASPWRTLYDGEEHIEFIGRHALEVPTRLRLLDYRSHAAFYSTGWGILPWSLGEGEPWEWIYVYRVKQAYSGPIPEQPRHY